MELHAFSKLLIVFLLAHLSNALFIWPQPQSVEDIPGPPIIISNSFIIRYPKDSPKVLRRAAARCTSRVLSEKWSPVSQQEDLGQSEVQFVLSRLTISVSDLESELGHGVDVSYTLTVDYNNTVLSANTTWGALYGLETFSQLVQYYTGNKTSFIPQGVRISDWPLYPHRGVVLDTSRNFYSVSDIFRTIRAMGYNKLNVLHWHILDSHSFPLFLESEPELAMKGSYGSEFVYSTADVKRIVAFGRSRGVRIMPEIDSPGHTASWGAAYPEIVTCMGKLWWDSNTQTWEERFASEPGAGQLNPLHPTTYEVLRHVIDDVSKLFPDSLFHSGADEVSTACWNSSKDIADMISSGNATFSSLLTMFIQKTYPMIRAHNKTVVYWEDILLGSTINVSAELLPKETTIIHTWNNGAINTKAVTSAGYPAIVSSSDFLYLDCGRGNFLLNDSRYDQPNATMAPQSLKNDATFNYGGTGGSWCAPYKTWQRIYDYDLTYGLTEKEAALVLGAETALWSEMADPTVLDGLLWPRSAALAELTWSGNRDGRKKRTAEAGYRLAEWRERMVLRGVAAQPLMPRWCLRNRGMCNINI